MTSLYDEYQDIMTKEEFELEMYTYVEIQHLLFDTFKEYLDHVVEIILEERFTIYKRRNG